MKGREVRSLIKQMREKEAQGVPSRDQKQRPVPFSGFSFGESLARNMALAGMLVLTVAAVRTASLPTGQTVLTAVQSMIDGQWNERLGKIDFVSNFFPETVSVFFDTSSSGALTAPCFGEVTHVFSKDEPYIAYQSSDGKVYAAAAGQVMSIAHGPAEEMILRVRHDDGLETLYYNLREISVREGDEVTESSCLGVLMAGQEAAVEVRRSGLAIDPKKLMQPRSGAAQ